MRTCALLLLTVLTLSACRCTEPQVDDPPPPPVENPTTFAGELKDFTDRAAAAVNADPVDTGLLTTLAREAGELYDRVPDGLPRNGSVLIALADMKDYASDPSEENLSQFSSVVSDLAEAIR